MTVHDLKEKLKTNGLGQYFDQLRAHLRPTIRLYLTPDEEENIGIGKSKIGGRPDLPENTTWATETVTTTIHEKQFLFFNKTTVQSIIKPLSFIAQINLSEIAPLDTENLLPAKGILYFYYAAEQDASGFDYKDKDKFKVLYYDGDLSKLSRAVFPDDLPEDAKFIAGKVTAIQEISLPYYSDDLYDIFSEEEADTFFDEVYFEAGNFNKMLGYADIIQNEMELECELVTNGLYCGDSSGYNDPRAKALEPNAKNWRLLLQVDSNEECDMMWGDVGKIYFWIKVDDLKEKRFEKAWFSFQCS